MIELDRDADTPLGEQIVAGLSRLVEDGRLGAGARLPSLRRLAARLGVSSFTVVNAYDRLVALGLIESRPGAGYFVRRRSRLVEVEDLEGLVESPLSTLGFAMNALDPGEDAVLAGSGFLPPDWLAEALPAALVARALRAQAATGAPAPAQGMASLRRRLAEKLQRQGVPAAAGSLVTTYGATHAYDLLMRALLTPGEAVLVEDPGYLVLHTQLRQFGARLLPVPRHADGPDLDTLETLAAEHRPRMLFTQTLLHNPGGGSTSAAKCHRLLGLAERYDFRIVEDDVYGDLAAPGALRLAALDEFRRVFYVASFTKVLNPSLRVGFVAAPAAFVQALVEHKMLGVLTGAALQEAIVAAVLESGRYAKHLQKLRTRLANMRAAAESALVGAGVEIASSDDGLFVWGRLPGVADMDELVRRALREDILLARGAMFSPTGGFGDHLRFNAVHSADRRLAEFLRGYAGGQGGAIIHPFPNASPR